MRESGGEGGIRTHGTVSRTLAFEASTFNRSVTSPQWSVVLVYQTRRVAGYGSVYLRNVAQLLWRESAAGGEEGLQ